MLIFKHVLNQNAYAHVSVFTLLVSTLDCLLHFDHIACPLFHTHLLTTFVYILRGIKFYDCVIVDLKKNAVTIKFN